MFFILKIQAAAVPKLRPRVTRRGTYTPAKTADWEQQVRTLAKLKANSLGIKHPWEGPVIMHTAFYFKKPGYLSKKVHGHVKKPDLDNLLKSIKDALNGIVYKDDSQVIRSSESKNYLLGENAKPFVTIKVEGITHEEITPIRDHGNADLGLQFPKESR